VSARRGFVLRTLDCEDRRLCSDWRTSDQERQASTRRGRGWANIIHSVAGNALASAFAKPRGLTPPAPALLCGCPPAKNDFCDAQTHVHNSGGCQPAVVWESRLQKLSIHVRQTTRLTTLGSVFRVVQRGAVTDVRFAIALGLFVCSAFAQYLLPMFGSQLRVCRRQQKTIAVGSDVT
jgi:hypothetical protein